MINLKEKSVSFADKIKTQIYIDKLKYKAIIIEKDRNNKK